jgi:glycine/serine hydroxymethyltransferase
MCGIIVSIIVIHVTWYIRYNEVDILVSEFHPHAIVLGMYTVYCMLMCVSVCVCVCVCVCMCVCMCMYNEVDTLVSEFHPHAIVLGTYHNICIVCIGVVSVVSQYMVYNCVYYCDTCYIRYNEVDTLVSEFHPHAIVLGTCHM